MVLAIWAPDRKFADRRRSALTMTETELKVMAALAIIGLRRTPEERVQHPRGDGNSQGVVEEREEEILADVSHRRRG